MSWTYTGHCHLDRKLMRFIVTTWDSLRDMVVMFQVKFSKVNWTDDPAQATNSAIATRLLD